MRQSKAKSGAGALLLCAALAGCLPPRAGTHAAIDPPRPPQTLPLPDDADAGLPPPVAGGKPGAGALTVPLFDGSPGRTHEPPAGPLRRPLLPDYRQLYDMVLACWPADSWFRGDLYVEGRVASRTDAGTVAALDATTGTVTRSGDRYVALVARIPLVSATELDKERHREAERNGKIADAVGELVGAFSERVMSMRQLALARALEKRAQERVRAGVADTAEQVHYLEQVAGLEVKIGNLQAAEIKARLHMVGMCDARRMRAIDDYLQHFNQVR